MPSPFSGMDPYLEHPAIWPSVHAPLIAWLGEELNRLLPRCYWVATEERVYVEVEGQEGREIKPDVTLSKKKRGNRMRDAGWISPGFVAIAEAIEIPVREHYLVIRRMPQREVVTVIELLSLENKRPGTGMREYLKKRDEVLSSCANLVEIDLLRGGLPPSWAGRLGQHDYRVAAYAAWERPLFWVKGWRLRDPLPAVPIPLRETETPASIDLAQAVREVYARGAYDRVIDYGQAPEPPLSPEDHRWAQEQIRRREA